MAICPLPLPDAGRLPRSHGVARTHPGLFAIRGVNQRPRQQGSAALDLGRVVWIRIALITATAGLIAITAAHRLNFPQRSERLADLSVWAGWWLAELAIAWVAVRYLGRVWDHWIAPQKSHPLSSSPAEL